MGGKGGFNSNLLEIVKVMSDVMSSKIGESLIIILYMI